jgi:hypothetical protein
MSGPEEQLSELAQPQSGELPEPVAAVERANKRADEGNAHGMRGTDRDLARRRHDEAVAHQAAHKAHGLFLRADEVAALSHDLQCHEAGDEDADRHLARFVSSLLDQRGIGPIELRAANPFERPLTLAELDEHPSERCGQCGGPSMDEGRRRPRVPQMRPRLPHGAPGRDDVAL